MEKITLMGNPMNTVGSLPEVGTPAPDFTLVAQDLSEIKLSDYAGKRVVLNIFPSMDTDVCAASVRRFNVEAASLPDTVVICVSMDLPFAATRFCTANGIKNVTTGSGFRSDFGKVYGVEIADGPMKGLYARSLVVIDRDGTVLANELVQEITNEPDYSIATDKLK
ncbi:MAG: thiol peroxidase [Muribaculaceae bacterium]|nr:thiol peroxidase [Muribaculaceae bacterium]